MRAHLRILRGWDNNRSCTAGVEKERTKSISKTSKRRYTRESTYSNPNMFSRPRRRR